MKHAKSILFFLVSASFPENLRGSLFGYYPFTAPTSRLLEAQEWKEKGTSKWNALVQAYGKKGDEGWGKKGAVSLARLWFGKSFFAPADALSPTTQAKTIPLTTYVIAPRISVNEHSIVGALQYTYTVDERWQIGARMQLPLIHRNIKKRMSSLGGKSIFGGPIVTDFYQKKNDVVEGTSGSVHDFAIRLDFASLLPATTVGVGTKVALVNYHNPVTDTITVGGIDITDKQTNSIDRHPLTTVRVPAGQLPQPPFGILLDPALVPAPETATTLPSLSNNGQTENERNKFDQLIDYTPLSQNSETQSTLWLVPSVIATEPAQLTVPAKIIGTMLNSLVERVDQTPEGSFEKAGIAFADKKTSGLGDVHAAFFTNYLFNTTDYIQLFFGISLPTGKKISLEERNIFAHPLGNNGHTALSCGIAGRWAPCRWFELVSIGWVEAALHNNSFEPVFFKGATVRHFSHYVRAWNSWTTVGGRVDAYFHLPTHYAEEGYTTFIFGYELYHKSKDRLTFVYPQAVDVTGVLRPVDSVSAAAESNRRAHTVSIDCAYTHAEQITLSVGWQYVVAGLHVARTMGWQCGIEASF